MLCIHCRVIAVIETFSSFFKVYVLIDICENPVIQLIAPDISVDNALHNRARYLLSNNVPYTVYAAYIQDSDILKVT